MTQPSGDRSDMVPALGWLCPISVGPWPGVNGIIAWQIINGSQSFLGPLRATWQASGLNHRNVSKYIFSKGSTTVLLTHLTAFPLTLVNSQLFNNGMYKAQALSRHFAKKRALAGCGELISTHGANFLGGLTTVVASGRAVNRLSERWMLKATSCGRNCPGCDQALHKYKQSPDRTTKWSIHGIQIQMQNRIRIQISLLTCIDTEK